MNGDDFTEGGLHLEDYKELARMVESRVDLFNISCGSHERQELFVRTHPSAFLDHGCNVYLAAAIKQVVSKPVSCVGALGDPEQCEEIIASSQADIVELGRRCWRIPSSRKKAYTGQKEDITPLPALLCLSGGECNQWYKPLFGESGDWSRAGGKILCGPAPEKEKGSGGGRRPRRHGAAITAAGADMRYCCTRRRMRLGGR